ncbi:ABC-2 type transport system permease protein [Bacillus niacini]|uniref:ABC-2 type transport system permease protein n=1 Tax=Neobacillus niacini TaxID=86668 RepID=A0A852TCA3_9BACI|nr:ABC transporter permease [Neobacillus niacini]NYE05575.1 ABC-2 type transport system permease protein [Neobacillus niacini]
MFDDKKLWKDRSVHRLKEFGVYLRYILNGHLVVVLLFLVGTAAFYYQNWISSLSREFPAEIIIAVILGIFLTHSPVYTFLLEADQVFLIPLEARLRSYFLRSGMLSLVFQGYILLMIFALVMPMYAHVSENGFQSFFIFLIILLVIKGWNIAVNWKIHFYVQPSVYTWDMIVRYFINVLFTFLLFKNAHILFLVLFAFIMASYYRSFYVRTKKMGLKWDLLIAQEEKRMASFYRLANLFTDVPKLKDTVKRRKWLDWLINRISFSQDKTFDYLYARTFLRSSDYLGLFIRLTVIGGFALYFISFGAGQIVLSLLFIYLTGFQLLPLWNHHQNKLWIDLYPVTQDHKTTAFHSLLMRILFIQSFIFTVIILFKGEWIFSLIILLSGLLFSFLFVNVYSKKRLKA